MARFETASMLLCGEWLSSRLGYVTVTREPMSRPGYVTVTHGTPTAESYVFNVRKAFTGGEPVALIFVCQQVVNLHFELDILQPQGWNKRMYLVHAHSKRQRIVWHDTPNGDTNIASEDRWDKKLLDAIRKGTEWINAKEYGLYPAMEVGLRNLAEDSQTERSTGRTVALCIATKNRLWQLRRALPLNLLHAWPHRRWVTVHLVVCDSADDTLNWVLSRCRTAIEEGLLRVYQTETGSMPYWHASVGKNTSHMVAKEEVLVCVDGDNLIGEDFPVNVASHFDDGYRVLQYEAQTHTGCCGRIACYREEFHYIRGYDEDAFPMGAQDVDLVMRLKMLHNRTVYKRVGDAIFCQAISNDQQSKVRCCDPKYGRNLEWRRMNEINKTLFKRRRERGEVRRNMDKDSIGVNVWRVRLR